MKIKEKLSQSRRDFTAIYVCEHCGYEYKSYGYDDTNFHHNVIPNMECPVCNKKSVDGLPTSGPIYQDHVVL